MTRPPSATGVPMGMADRPATAVVLRLRSNLYARAVPIDQTAGRREELLVFHVPHFAVAARGQGEVGHELTEPPVGEQPAQLRHGLDQLIVRGSVHGTMSPIDGYDPTGTGRTSMTSTRTR